MAILPHYLQMALECFEDKDIQMYSGDIKTVGRVGKVRKNLEEKKKVETDQEQTN